MKKTVFAAAKILLGLVLLLAVLLLAHPLWLGPVARTLANRVVPGMTKTEFNLGSFAVDAYRGTVAVGDLLLGNPDGYDERVALKVGSVDILADTGTVASDVVRLKEVVVKDVFVCYARKDGMDNFARISKNVSGGKKSSSDQGVSQTEGKSSPATEGGKDGKSRKVVIERLSVSGIVVKFGPVAMPVPPVTLTGVGEKSNGVTMAELGSQLLTAIMDGAGSLKDGAGMLGELLGDGAGAIGDQLKKGDMKAVKDAASILKSMFK
jgi:hypothetical protein